MEQIVINKNDELVMKLLHYFITEMGYSPIVLHGAKEEIWLENLESDYKIVRIVSNYIHNDEQLDFDLFRTRQIMKQIKKKTFSYKVNTLSLFVNLGDNVDINKYIHTDNIDCAYLDKISDLKKYEFITNTFPSITKKTKFTEKGMNLFLKISGEIGQKNELESVHNEEIFKTKTPFITYGLIIVNIIIFLLCNINTNYISSLVLFNNIGNEYYRLFTAAFTHYDIFHLIFNMYALYIVGSQIESFFGKTKYVIIYLISAFASSLLSMVFLSSNSVSLGASGAIFGLFGALLYFGYHYRIYLGNVLKSQIIPLVIFNLALGFLVSGIDNAAHIGGLVGGILTTMALGIKYKSSKSEKINGLILLLIYIIFLIYIGFIGNI